MKIQFTFLLAFFASLILSAAFSTMEAQNIYINEISGNEKWLELYNDKSNAVDLSNYTIRKIDEEGVTADWIIPNGITIAAKGFLTWTQNDQSTDGSTFTWGISAKKDVAFKLLDTNKNEIDFFDVKMSAGLYSEGNKKTVGRKTNGAAQLVIFYNGGTKGSSNNTGTTQNPLTITYPQLTNIPTLHIQTTNSQTITSKETYVTGKLVAVSADPREELSGDGSGVAIEIKGRGNSTWGMAKKPYRIKFASKTNFLNLPAKAKSWTLLANYADKSLIRNAVAFKMSEIAGLEFSPAARFVDVVLNGEYQGCYMVSDQIEENEKRVPVEEQDPIDFNNLTGGYLLEIDGFAYGEPVWFSTDRGVPITVKYPNDDEIVPQQLSYITQFTQQFENTLFTPSYRDTEIGYRALVDTASLINWYICCELTGNSDAFWSTYIYKKKDIDKFFFGPLWDYDIAFNNDSRQGNASEKLMRVHGYDPKVWIQRIWTDPWFTNAVKNRWEKLVNDEKILDQLLLFIDQTVELIEESQEKNYDKWGHLSSRVYLEQNLYSTYPEYIADLKNYLEQRVAFLSADFAKITPVKPAESFIPENFYYQIQNLKSNNVIQVKNGLTTPNAVLELWAPQADNENQEWKIVPVGNNKFRIINRKSGLAMAGNGRAVNLIQVPVDAANIAQQWTITSIGNQGLYGLVNVGSDYSVNNSGGNTYNGTAVIEYDKNILASQNQQWYLKKTRALPRIKQNIIHTSGLFLGNNPDDGQNGYSLIQTASDDGSQAFFIDPIEGESGTYYIQQASSGWYLIRNTARENWATGWTNDLNSLPIPANAKYILEPKGDDSDWIQIRNLGSDRVLGTDEAGNNSNVYSDKSGTDSKNYWKIVPAGGQSDINRAYNHSLSVSGSNHQLSIDGLEGNNSLLIYTVSGQLVFSAETNTPRFSHVLEPGCYILSIRGNNYYRGVVIIF